MPRSTIGVQVMVATGDRAELDSVCNYAVTLHATGTPAHPSLHWATLEEFVAWYEDLGQKVHHEVLRRTSAEAALADMDETLRNVGAR